MSVTPPILPPSALKNSNRFRSSFGAVDSFAEPCGAVGSFGDFSVDSTTYITGTEPRLVSASEDKKESGLTSN